MPRLLRRPAAVAGMAFLAAAAWSQPAFAQEAGISAGLGYGNWPLVGAAEFRSTPWPGPWETIVSVVRRNQATSPDNTYALDTLGVGGAVGAHWGPVRGGVGVELALLRRLQAVAWPAPGGLGLATSFGAGAIVEPYVAADLPFFHSDFTRADLTLRYPIYAPDPAIGPRVMLTLWFGTNQVLGEEESEDPEAAAPKPVTPKRPGGRR